MKICLAQTKPVKGDMLSNIANHKKLINLAIFYKADIIVFPELSITGYEPELAKELATDKDDNRFDDFQNISNNNRITIGVGVPTKSDLGICITMVIFQPHHVRQTYSKKYLHPDEEPFFVNGESSSPSFTSKPNVAFAICYELSVPAHSERAFNMGAEMYIASVAKSPSGVEKASKSLADIATTYSMMVFMSNSIGPSDNFEGGGKTSAWNTNGLLLGQLNDIDEGILLVDTDTQKVIVKMLH